MGIASLEDKMLRRAVMEVFNVVSEVDALEFSYGFRAVADSAPADGNCRSHIEAVAELSGRNFLEAVSYSSETSSGVQGKAPKVCRARTS